MIKITYEGEKYRVSYFTAEIMVDQVDEGISLDLVASAHHLPKPVAKIAIRKYLSSQKAVKKRKNTHGES